MLQASLLPVPAARPRTRWLAPLALLLASCLLYSIHLDRAPHFDELYHVLAARGWLHYGTLRIAEGSYERGGLFTILIAWFFRLFGESQAVARLPSVIAMGVLVACLFVWLRALAGRPAAWIGSLLFALSPFTVDLAQFARFYALQTLAFWLGAVAFFAACTGARGPARRLALLLAALLALSAATYLQITTLIGIFGLGVWFGLAIVLPWLFSPRLPARRRWLLIAAALLLLAAALAGLWLGGTGPALLERWRWAPPFQPGLGNQFWFYHFWLDFYFPSLWPLLPLLTVVALVARPGPALLAAVVFGTAILVHSFTPAKNFRYLAYALPFLFALWGIALGEIGGRLQRFTSRQIRKLAAPLRQPRLRSLARQGLWVALVLFLVAGNTAFVRTATLLAGITVPPDTPPADWRAARAALGPRLAQADIVLTTSELEALYFLDRYDVVVSQSRLDELRQLTGADEFGRDFRTGRPVVASADAVAKIIACYPSGLVVSPVARWRVPIQLSPAVADLIERSATEVPMPPHSHMIAYEWHHPGLPPPSGCLELRRSLARSSPG